jgi:CRISPR-associated endonuclease Cas1/CRISPR-associated protein Cas4
MSGDVAESLDLVPARMVNEFVYCPRLAFIEWVEGDFRDNIFTVEGRHAHRRVDREGPASVEAQAERVHARSVYLSGPVSGIVARIDLVEADGERATPVDYKRGSPPDNEERCHEPERVQLCAQALVLEDNGFRCDEGVLYFTKARRRVTVPITDDLRARTIQAVADLRTLARSGHLPPVLVDSPKCQGCSLAGVCLPDEVELLRNIDRDASPVRRLFPARDDALPLHVHAHHGKIGRRGECLRISARDRDTVEVRLLDTSQVAVYGNIQVTTQTIRSLCEHGIPLCFFTSGGWFYGLLQGLPHRNVGLRRLQHLTAADAQKSLPIARSLVDQKIRNQRTLLRRNAQGAPAQALTVLRHFARKARNAGSLETLLGLEGSAARVYFNNFSSMLRASGERMEFIVSGRNRRPPRDPVNALLSLAYALLAKDLTIILSAVGFDPYCGFFHQPRYGRPSLALDLMEPFRPIIADSVVIGAINNGVVQPRDFSKRLGAVSLTDSGRRRFIQAYERRMDDLVTHPLFGYRVSYRRVLEVQARLLGRMLAGEIKGCPEFVTR